MPQLPDFSQLSHAEKDALIRALFARLEVVERRIAALEARLGEPPKTPDNSSLPPSKGQKPNQAEKAERNGPRQGSLGRKGSGRAPCCDPDETVITKAMACMHCQATLGEADHVLHGRYDRIDLPVVRPVVTRVERLFRLRMPARPQPSTDYRAQDVGDDRDRSARNLVFNLSPTDLVKHRELVARWSTS
jgi:transposase